jgi:hypothetical protein
LSAKPLLIQRDLALEVVCDELRVSDVNNAGGKHVQAWRQVNHQVRLRWRLWHGRVDRAIRDLEQLLVRLKEGGFSIARLHSLGAQLLPYARSNRGAIVNYGKRYRAGLRVATTLAESAVNSLVGKRMVKKQQIRWSLHGAHMLMQIRAAEINGELRNRLRAPFRQPEPNVPPIFKPKPPLLRAA